MEDNGMRRKNLSRDRKLHNIMSTGYRHTISRRRFIDENRRHSDDILSLPTLAVRQLCASSTRFARREAPVRLIGHVWQTSAPHRRSAHSLLQGNHVRLDLYRSSCCRELDGRSFRTRCDSDHRVLSDRTRSRDSRPTPSGLARPRALVTDVCVDRGRWRRQLRAQSRCQGNRPRVSRRVRFGGLGKCNRVSTRTSLSDTGPRKRRERRGCGCRLHHLSAYCVRDSVPDDRGIAVRREGSGRRFVVVGGFSKYANGSGRDREQCGRSLRTGCAYSGVVRCRGRRRFASVRPGVSRFDQVHNHGTKTGVSCCWSVTRTAQGSNEVRKATRNVIPDFGIPKQKRHCLLGQCRF